MTPQPKPFIFTGPMVLAIMADRKTNSRRIIKFPKKWEHLTHNVAHQAQDGSWIFWYPGDSQGLKEFTLKHYKDGGIKPRHQPGDIVYVGEHLFNQDCFVAYKCDGLEFTVPETHKAKVWPWKKSLLSNIFMPRWAARTWLEILDVKAEKIQDISTEDVIAEGIDVLSKLPLIVPPDTDLDGLVLKIARMEMKKLWNSIHGPDAWKDNDWVWVYKFKRVEKLEED